MREAVIASAVRTPAAKAPKGSFRNTRPDELAAIAIRAALERAGDLDPAKVDDVILGCAMPEAEQGMNVARIASLRAGIPVEASAVTINRFCSSGLQSIAFAAERILAGNAETIVAGGTESMSLVPMVGHKFVPNPALVQNYPDVYLSTGLVAENHARESHITRDEQDAFALRSHQRALAAIDAGRFEEETVPVTVQRAEPANGNGAGNGATGSGQGNGPTVREVRVTTDEGPRADTSLGKLGSLRPAFRVNGSVTAGNSSQMSDGAAAAVVTTAEHAARLGLTPLARFVTYTTAGVKPELFGLGPVPAMRKALRLANLTIDDIDLVELNEAFAAQVLACVREFPIDPDRLNVNGGAIALGHPLGCTGAKLTATLLHELRRRNGRYGMVTMCVGGGMGAAGIFERL
ncbi:MAG: acetyl-CoA C-acyltransferase [Acidobacteria bacterium]|nr:acetyl-CoA C-acyltransferase [Acidobacteriota bacterium]MYJ05885.1 acetyl-CoA C-acyltransferase [Acidobacteriota bacterium]